MASGPITSWQIDGETMETVTDFIFLGSKITADGDCSHEIKRHLVLGRKAINPNDEIMAKDTCYLTDEETKIRNEIIEQKNKAYIDGFGYVAPAKTKTIIVDSDGDINKKVGTME